MRCRPNRLGLDACSLSLLTCATPQDEALHDVLERLRGRFKATASMMGLLQDYFPKEPEGETGGQGSLSF